MFDDDDAKNKYADLRHTMFITLLRSKCGLSLGTAAVLSYNNGCNRYFSSYSDCEGSCKNSRTSNNREVSMNGKVVLITGATAGIGSKFKLRNIIHTRSFGK